MGFKTQRGFFGFFCEKSCIMCKKYSDFCQKWFILSKKWIIFIFRLYPRPLFKEKLININFEVSRSSKLEFFRSKSQNHWFSEMRICVYEKIMSVYHIYQKLGPESSGQGRNIEHIEHIEHIQYLENLPKFFEIMRVFAIFWCFLAN